MSTAEQWLGASGLPSPGLNMPYARTVQRQRRTVDTDPYSGLPRPGGDWADPVDIEGAHVTGVPSTVNADVDRRQQTSRPVLVCPADADVRVGDRIIDGDHVYQVEEHPARGINPFTGWVPPQEVPLLEVTG